jgi:hypothetical protein
VGKSFLFVFAAILPILNPAATAPIFLGLTDGASAGTRALLARRIARNLFAVWWGARCSDPPGAGFNRRGHHRRGGAERHAPVAVPGTHGRRRAGIAGHCHDARPGVSLRPATAQAAAVMFLRLLAFILLCVGVQIMWDGPSELLRELPVEGSPS